MEENQKQKMLIKRNRTIAKMKAERELITNISACARTILHRHDGEDEFQYSFELAILAKKLDEQKREVESSNYKFRENKVAELNSINQKIEFIRSYFNAEHDGFMPIEYYLSSSWIDACLAIARDEREQNPKANDNQLAKIVERRAKQLGLKTRRKKPPSFGSIRKDVVPKLSRKRMRS